MGPGGIATIIAANRLNIPANNPPAIPENFTYDDNDNVVIFENINPSHRKIIKIGNNWEEAKIYLLKEKEKLIKKCG